MKTISLLSMLAAITASAQAPPIETASEASPPVAARAQVFSGDIATRRTPDVAFSGAIVEATRSNPLQLINPRAPRRFGDGYDNVSFDPITGRGQGIRLFTISF